MKTLLGGGVWRLMFCSGLVVVCSVGVSAFASTYGADGAVSGIASVSDAFAAQAVDGKRSYETVCSACHQSDGGGVPAVFPPLKGSEWVTGDEGRLIRIILHGLSGEIEVNGTTYSGMMPPFGSALRDAEIAALATYIRSSWANASPPVGTAAVARIRASTAQRKTPWTAAELETLTSNR